MTKRGRSRRMVVLLVVVMLVLFAEGALVAAAFLSPTAGERLEGAVAAVDRAWSGTKSEPGIRSKVAGAFHRGYQDWIVPLWSRPTVPEGTAEFTACVKCHKNYATTRKFSTVYMNHPLHAQLGLSCATCHPQNAHPNPPHPLEKVCANCHTEVQEQGKCGLCHPPASLPHFYLLGAPRQGVVACDVCHPKNSFLNRAATPQVHVGDFSGADRQQCLSCHQQSTCQQCHAVPHPSNWVRVHGLEVGQGGPTACFACHSQTWCADRCHSVTPSQPFIPRPLPPAGVRP